MTSVRNSKAKLQPLYYTHKPPGGDQDLEAESHLLELYNDPDTAPDSSKNKQVSPEYKPKSLKAGLYMDIISSEGVLSSDGEDLSKANFPGSGKNKVPLLIRKPNAESRVFKPVPSNNSIFKRASMTPTKSKITEHTHEEDTVAESLETEPNIKPTQENEEKVAEKNEGKNGKNRKAVKHQSASKQRKNKENIENSPPTVFRSQQIDRKMLENISAAQPPKSRVKSPENYVKIEEQVEQVEKPIEINKERKEARVPGLKELGNGGASQKTLLSSQPRQLTEGSRGLTEMGSEFHIKKFAGKDIYKELLKEMAVELADNYYMTQRPQKATKDEKAAMQVVEERLGKMHAERLYELFVRHCATKETHRKAMVLGKLLLFMKNFGMFEDEITREEVNLTFVKRCPQKFADFASFVDILYKLQKLSDFHADIDTSEAENSQFSIKDLKFQRYLQAKIFEKQNQMRLNSEANMLRIDSVESDIYGIDQEAIRVLNDYDERLKKIFRSYWPFNNKYQGKTSDHRKGIMLLREYKQFCYDYHLIPSLLSLNQALELFRKAHLEGEEAIDFKGFVHILCLATHLEFPHGRIIHSKDSFAKRLAKLCGLLVEASYTVPERACR